MIEDIKNIVTEALKENDPKNFGGNISSNTSIYGHGGVLDSLGLVTLLVNIEQKIDAKFNVAITIADEKAMSQSRSPFRSVDSLVKYLHLTLNDKNG